MRNQSVQNLPANSGGANGAATAVGGRKVLVDSALPDRAAAERSKSHMLASREDFQKAALAEMSQSASGINKTAINGEGAESPRQEITAQLAEHKYEAEKLRAELAQKQIVIDDLARQLDGIVAKHASSLEELSAQLLPLQNANARYRASLVDAERRVEATKRTLSFRLGYLILHARTEFRLLPQKLYQIWKDARSRRAGHGPAADRLPFQIDVVKHELEETYSRHGIHHAETLARARATRPADLTAVLTHLARLALRSDATEACRLAREATTLDPRPFRRKWLAFLVYDAGCITDAHELLLSLPGDLTLQPSENHKAQFISGAFKLFSHSIDLPPLRWKPAFEPTRKRVLYVASSAAPHHTTGYTVRTHGIIKGIAAAGWEVYCVTRPGYPNDRVDSVDIAGGALRVIDGIRYEALEGPHRRKTPLDRYLHEAAKIIETKARRLRPEVIHAASNYEAALPALMAARKLGIPFVYEVRGLWEYTSAAKVTDWERTERFALDRKLETLAASNADAVLTLTRSLAGELIERGVPAEKITLTPNAIDPNAWTTIARDDALATTLGLKADAFVVGYVGSILVYEGLDDLLTALSIVKKQIPGAVAVIVGDGDALPALRRQVQDLGLECSVHFVGKVQTEEVPRYFSLFDAVALPRKPLKVCELVSPLKPLEAMSMQVPLVVSDVSALREMVVDGKTALVHRAGDPASLATCLTRLAQEPGLRLDIANAAREDVLANRTWSHIAQEVAAVYQKLVARSGPADAETNAEAGALATSSVARAPMTDLAEILVPVPLAPGANVMTPEERETFDEKLEAGLRLGGISVLSRLLAAQVKGRSQKLVSYCDLRAAAVCLAAGEEQFALALAEGVLNKDGSLNSLRGAMRIFYNAAQLERAAALAKVLEASQKEPSESDRTFINEIRGCVQLAEWVREPARPRTIPLQSRRVLNVLAFSLPYTSVGYATRSHGLALGINHAGWEIRPYTRPGFPFDFKAELEGQVLPEQDEIDGITYRRIFDLKRRGVGELEYLQSAIAHFERIIEQEQPEVVHAASNYVTALPVLIAARRLGVPFVYEVRGFWEVTRASRDEAFENTSKYRFMQYFEALVARHADRVVTITTGMKEELAQRGVLVDKISVALNSVDPDRFLPMPKDEALAARLGLPANVPVIGYIGSFVDYEGLDDLVTAAAAMHQAGVDFRLLLVGDGAILAALKMQAELLGLNDKAIFTGRVPFSEVESYYSLIDVAPFPRKPWEVCELVSPLKPFEAMALEKAVVVSSTRALLEAVTDSENGLVFDKGSVTSLQEVLTRLVAGPELRRQLGQAARQRILRERTWDEAGRVCTAAYAGCVVPAGQAVSLPG